MAPESSLDLQTTGMVDSNIARSSIVDHNQGHEEDEEESEISWAASSYEDV